MSEPVPQDELKLLKQDVTALSAQLKEIQHILLNSSQSVQSKKRKRTALETLQQQGYNVHAEFCGYLDQIADFARDQQAQLAAIKDELIDLTCLEFFKGKDASKAGLKCHKVIELTKNYKTQIPTVKLPSSEAFENVVSQELGHCCQSTSFVGLEGRKIGLLAGANTSLFAINGGVVSAGCHPLISLGLIGGVIATTAYSLSNVSDSIYQEKVRLVKLFQALKMGIRKPNYLLQSSQNALLKVFEKIEKCIVSISYNVVYKDGSIKCVRADVSEQTKAIQDLFEIYQTMVVEAMQFYNLDVKTADDTGKRRLEPKSSDQQDSLEAEYVNEVHVQDFIKALRYNPNCGLPEEDSHSAEHISAWSDALPRSKLNRKLSKSKKKLKEQESATPKGISHSLLRYPLIIWIGFVMLIELIAYISLRQIVRIWENVFSWRGQKKRLRERLRESRNYKEWCEAADALDRYMGKNEWKKTVPYAYYDYRLLQKVVRHLKKYRQSDTAEDAANLSDVLYVCLKQNFAGIENARMYSNTYLGTKSLIEEFVEEVTKSIDALAKSKHISTEEKRLAFKLYSKNYGRTAFCLSGGAGFGYYHLGVIRALLDRGLLPTIITGTSAGSLMSAIVCTRTDEELNEILNPALARRINICQDSWKTMILRFIKTGAVFDAEQWCREAMWFCKGSITFKEAYERTGRIFNVSVIPYDPHSPPKLLNYNTAPDCVIWSAILASAAIPGILEAVVLMQKKKGSDHLTPYNYGHKFKDGSLSTDIPTLALNTQFNVNYTVVSQVNPHVHLFFYANQGSPGRPVAHLQGRGWRGGFLASTIEQVLILDLAKWLKVFRSLKLLPKVHDQDWSSVWLQKFDGSVTILPKTSLSDWFHILRDPDEERLKELMISGQLRTWPKVSMISNRMRIEFAIEKSLQMLRMNRKNAKNKKNARSDAEILKLSQQLENHELGHGNTSDAGSGDELLFLSRRRVSMPDGNFRSMDEKDAINEQHRRRKFMAQFIDTAKEGNNATQSRLFQDSDSDSHALFSAGSPDGYNS
ncbi:acyl transferase/acyl hydrolase/lysophospholipase [Blakeslea trispora]|nr:acyl transferase/acyl hydrolase/lysophospholipase [Blakeslea trispora]